MFHEAILSMFHKHFPIKQFKSNKRHELSPYVTSALRNSIKERNRLERLAKKWPLTYREYYRKYRNTLTSTLRDARNKYYQDRLKSSQGNPKSHWKCINTILGRTTNNNNNIIELEPPCREMDVANKFNYHFLNVANVPQDDNSNNHRQYLHNSHYYSLYLFPVSNEEIETNLKELKPNAPGYDDIPPKILKYNAKCLAKPLSHIINLSFRRGIFPDKLKIAKVTPIHKSGCKDNLSNYRPISVLPARSKIIEISISHRICNFLETHKLLSPSQHGFRRNHSTETAVLQFVSNIYKYLDDKLFVAGTFVDLSKAFDTLNHDVLINKLENVGIRGFPLKLLKNYLSNRLQSVYCNSTYSHYKHLRKGVPHGSILGPFYLQYI